MMTSSSLNVPITFFNFNVLWSDCQPSLETNPNALPSAFDIFSPSKKVILSNSGSNAAKSETLITLPNVLVEW